MIPFLKIVAQNLYSKLGCREEELSDVTVVFPNKRARLFLDHYLSECSDKPMWSPSYMTIGELFESQTDLSVADPLLLVSRLYDIYINETALEESIDSFWAWGEMMLNDFNDIDSNMVDTKILFSNIKDQHEMMRDISYLTDEQRNAINEFFKDFSGNADTSIKQKYMKIWNVMGNIYKKLRESLMNDRLAYDGMLQREVINGIEKSVFPSTYYVFVGFNRLNKAERALFATLKRSGKALFFWDYDNSYIDCSHEAGLFLRQNIKDFPNSLESKEFDNFSYQKKLTIVESSTDNAQARFIPEWLDGLPEQISSDTAIVLCDNSLLQPVLHCIPSDNVDAVNVTMGFPLTETPAYSLFSSLLDMQIAIMKSGNRYPSETILKLLTNPLVDGLSDEVGLLRQSIYKQNLHYCTPDMFGSYPAIMPLFKQTTDNRSLLSYLLNSLKMFIPVISKNNGNSLFVPLNEEALFRIYTQMNRFYELSNQGQLTVKTETMIKLITKVLRSISIPFHGEPIIGMQVMGLLETRNLDFKNILLLGANEGTLPHSMQESSFIPYNLRIAFGLTTMKEKSAISSYNFYHLIQRAERITMIYNGNSESPVQQKGMISRYLLQLMVDCKEQIERITLNTTRTDNIVKPIVAEKTLNVIQKMRKLYDGSRNGYLSPSALNSYINCKLQYYFRYIAGIKPKDKPREEIDYSLFGSILHKSAELTYNYLQSINPIINKEIIDSLLNDKRRIRSFVTAAFNELLFNGNEVTADSYSSMQTINYNVILRYIIQLLKMDRDLYCPFYYDSSENHSYSYVVSIDNPCDRTDKIDINLKGIMDRVDSKNGITRIVDYKTGAPKNNPKDIESLFVSKDNRNNQALQIFYYAYILSHHRDFKEKKIAPMLLYTRKTSGADEDSLYYSVGNEIITDFKNSIHDEFNKQLLQLLSEMFNPDKPFSQTENGKICQFCDYVRICRKENQ